MDRFALLLNTCTDSNFTWEERNMPELIRKLIKIHELHLIRILLDEKIYLKISKIASSKNTHKGIEPYACWWINNCEKDFDNSVKWKQVGESTFKSVDFHTNPNLGEHSGLYIMNDDEPFKEFPWIFYLAISFVSTTKQVKWQHNESRCFLHVWFWPKKSMNCE